MDEKYNKEKEKVQELYDSKTISKEFYEVLLQMIEYMHKRNI